MNLEKKSLDSLAIPEWYSKTDNEFEMNKLKSSIGEFGYIVPIIVNSENNHVIDGVKRLKALKELGYKEAYVKTLDIKIEQKEQVCSVLLNNITFEWDKYKLKNLLNLINDTNVDFIKLTGFSTKEIDAMKLDEKKKGFENGKHALLKKIYVAPPKHKFDIKNGDIFVLGEHRLMCGDSTNGEMVSKLMGGEKVDCIFTDPPYSFNESLYNHILDENIDDGHIFTMNDDVNIIKYLRNSTFEFKEFYVADFGFAALVNNRPNLQHILVSHETKGNVMNVDVTSEDFNSIIKMKYRETLDEDKTSHTQQKSVEFIRLFISRFAKKNVLDIFGGSGSTLIACEKEGKKCFLMEMQPDFCQLIIDRWETLTGKVAEKL